MKNFSHVFEIEMESARSVRHAELLKQVKKLYECSEITEKEAIKCISC